MGCSKCDNDCSPCNTCDKCCVQEECGCELDVDSSCVRYTKKDLECLGNSQGSTLEDVVTAIDEKICSVTNGTDGDSAYEIAVVNGFNGTEEEWLESLKGTNGSDGVDGTNGICECDEVVLYREDAQLTNVGVLSDRSDLSTASFLSPTGYTYTVATAGNYELHYKGTIKSNSTETLVSCIFVNGIEYTGSKTACSVPDGSYYNIATNFISNFPLLVGDVLTLQFSAYNFSGSALVKNVLQIKKLI